MLYVCAKVIVWPVFRVLYRLEMTGRDNVPATGPVIVVANHSSYMDPILVGLASKREVHYMAKAELFDVPILGSVIRRLNAFPVRRDMADRSAIRTSLELLAAGEVVLLFPEGTRYRVDGLGPIQPGAGVIAEKAGCPIVPITLVNTDRVMPDGARLPRWPKLKAIVGKPILPERLTGGRREARQAALELLERAMREVETVKRAETGQVPSETVHAAGGGE